MNFTKKKYIFKIFRYFRMWQEGIYKLVKDVLNGWANKGHLNQIFIAMVYKIEKPEFINQFRSIWICNVKFIVFVSK